jgi:hypothetical protein
VSAMPLCMRYWKSRKGQANASSKLSVFTSVYMSGSSLGFPSSLNG